MKLHLRKSVPAFFKLIRLPNLLILAATQVMVRIFIIGPKDQWMQLLPDWKFIVLVVATNMIAAAGYIINDYYDVKIDLINKPKRVVIGKIFDRRIAMLGHFILNFLAIVLGLLISWKTGAIMLTCAFLMWLYSNQLKRMAFAGNFVISFLTGLSLLIIGLHYSDNTKMVVVYAIFAFGISLIREIIKDIEDIKGDAQFGCRTLPILWGIPKTKVMVFALIAALLITILILIWKPSDQLILYFIGFLLPLFIWLSYKLVKAVSSREFHLLSQMCKIIMLGGVASMLFI